MHNDGVLETISSEIQFSDQVMTQAATSKAARMNRQPPTPPIGLIKETTEPPGPSSC